MKYHGYSDSYSSDSDAKSEVSEAETSPSQEVRNMSVDTLFKKIGKVFDLKAGFIILDIKCNIWRVILVN